MIYMSFKNIVLTSNTLLILSASWLYVDEGRTLMLIALIICAISNAYLITKGTGNSELTNWLSYTINIFLIAVGIWQMNYSGLYWYLEFRVGALICTIGLLNTYYRYNFILSQRKE